MAVYTSPVAAVVVCSTNVIFSCWDNNEEEDLETCFMPVTVTGDLGVDSPSDNLLNVEEVAFVGDVVAVALGGVPGGVDAWGLAIDTATASGAAGAATGTTVATGATDAMVAAGATGAANPMGMTTLPDLAFLTLASSASAAFLAACSAFHRRVASCALINSGSIIPSNLEIDNFSSGKLFTKRPLYLGLASANLLRHPYLIFLSQILLLALAIHFCIFSARCSNV